MHERRRGLSAVIGGALATVLIVAGCSTGAGAGGVALDGGQDAGGSASSGGGSGAGGTAAEGGAGTGSGTCNPPESVETICVGFAKALCDAEQRCTWGPMRNYKTAGQCEQAEADGCRLVLNAPGASPGFRAQYMKRAQDLDQISCAEYATHLLRQVAAPRPECLPHGDLPPHAPCRRNWQCQAGRCEGKGGQCGICVPLPGLGEPCGAHCALPNFCKDSVCVAPRQPGQPCEQGECTPGSFCASDRHCALPGGEDAACESHSQCTAPFHCLDARCQRFTPLPLGGACVDDGQKRCNFLLGQRCDGANCVQKTFKKLGEPCDSKDECDAGLGCKESWETVNGLPIYGRCADRPSVGMACPNLSWYRCVPPATCKDGTCALPELSCS